MKKLSVHVLCLVLACGALASAAPAQVVRGYTFANKTGVAANDFHIRFNTNASPPTPVPQPTAHSADIQDNAGASRGSFPRPAASGSAPGLGLSSNVLDYTDPTTNVRNNDQVNITVPFPGRNPGIPAEYWFTLNGIRIAGRVDRVALNESFSTDSAGLCSLDLASDPSSPSYMASNIRLWTGLTEAQMFDYADLSPANSLSLGGAPVSSASPAHFDLGALDAGSFALITYDLSYTDPDISGSRTAAHMVYGSQVPAPGALALAGVGLLTLARRRR